MSNHFHIFIYVPEPEDIGDEEILRRINALYRLGAKVYGFNQLKGPRT